MEENHQDDDMEDQEVEEVRSPSSPGVGGSRWNPTKEQIEMLERIYSSEGVRTPSAEQIQQITARLRVYGHIEGKNVFYWFQNHKARQRQKQRHDRLLAATNANANLNLNHLSPRFIGPPPLHYGLNNLNSRPIFPASHPTYHHHFLPNPNVMCSPYYHMAQANLGIYTPPQHHYSAPAASDYDNQPGMKKGSSPKPSISNATNHNQKTTRVSNKVVGVPPGSISGYCAAMMNNNDNSRPIVDDHKGNCMGMRTLNLFPLHPTGILEHKLNGINDNNNSAGNNSCATSSSSDNANMKDFGDHQQHPHFIDFFSSGHASSESS